MGDSVNIDFFGGGIAVLVEVDYVEPRCDVLGDGIAVGKGGSSCQERKGIEEELEMHFGKELRGKMEEEVQLVSD